MSKRALVVKNITREGPGLLAEVFKRRGIGYDVADLDAGEAFPDPVGYGALIILGGPDSANDENEKIRNESEAIRHALSAGTPYLGICLGLQLLVKAAGGKVMKNRVKEIGLRDDAGELYKVRLNVEGRKDPLFKGLEDEFRVFQLHGETVETASGMTLLASGRHCANQVVRVGRNAYGIQCHFELTQEMLARWMDEDTDLKTLDKVAVMKEFDSFYGEYKATGLRLLDNFLDIAGF